MGVTLLAPLFLAGLAALAVPIIIHLTQRERRDAIPFPSLMFLRKIPYRTVRRQRIRHWLLFLMRCAALVLLVAAFSRPLLERTGEGATALSRAREIVILLDNSFSMAYGDRWARALDAAREVVDGLGPGDRTTVVVFSKRAESLNRATADRVILGAVLDRARLSSEATRYGPALELTQKILAQSERPRREVVLISDFQKVGWESQEGLRLPEGTVLRSVDLSDSEASNLAVTDVFIERSYRGDRERLSITARLVNTGKEPANNIEVALEVNGQVMETVSLDLEPNNSASVPFEALALPQDRVSRGTVRAQADALARDNAFHFVVAPGEAVSVLVLEHRNARRNQSLYFSNALGLGVRPAFRVDVKKVNRFAPSDLDGRSVVVLNDAPFPGGASGRALRDFVSAGGGLLAALGPRSSAAAQSAEAEGLLPFIGPPVDRFADRGGTLGFLDYSHPIFELFSAPRTGDFSTARFFRYRRLQATGSISVLARFDNDAIALAEVQPSEGGGRVILWTSTLDDFWNNLAVQPVFLPFLHQLVSHLAGYEERENWFTVGQMLDLSGHAEMMSAVPPASEARDQEAGVGQAREWVVKLPSGERSVLDLENGSHVVELREQGFYELRPLDGQGTEPAGTFAANLDPAESDLSAFAPGELATALSAQDADGEWEGELVSLTPAERERRQGLWWFLLIGATVMLLGETAVSNRLSRLSR